MNDDEWFLEVRLYMLINLNSLRLWQSVSDMTDSGSQSDETTSGTTSTGCGVDLDEVGGGGGGDGSTSTRYRRKREKRTGGGGCGDHGSKMTGSGQRKKKGVLNAKERNMRRLESNERERKRMHDLNNQFQVIRKYRGTYN